MNATLNRTETKNRNSLRIDAVDHADAAWRQVLAHITRTGERRKLCIDQDGWLPARQIVFAAIVDGHAVGHLSFHIEPSLKGCVEARVDTHGMDSAYRNRGIESRLWNAAVNRARELRCTKLGGFDLGRPWELKD